MTAVEARGVRKSFGNDGVLDGVDLAVEPGELVVLMGENGVGKTVLLSCLAGSTTPADGTVRVDGRPVESDGGDGLSFLLQGAMSVDQLTGRENVRFYSRLHPSFTDRWREYVERFGIADDMDKLVKRYSAGMRRKLELSMALAVDAPVYLLDEPTAGVDLSTVGTFHDVIRERYEAGATFLVSSHRPADARIADRIAFMRDGRVTTVAPPGELLDTLPPVVRVSDAAAVEAATDLFVGTEAFVAGVEARGFLREDATLRAVREAVADADTAGPAPSVERAEPTYTDVFNYQAHVTEV